MSIKNDHIRPIPANGQKKNRHTFFSDKHNPFFQPKLTIGPTDDMYEREADAVADQVMRMPENKCQPFFSPQPIAIKPLVQTKCAACEEEEQLQRKEDELEEENVVSRKTITSVSGAGDDRVNEVTIQRQETPSEPSASEEESPESSQDPGINWFEMSRPFLTRGAGSLLYDPSAYGSISQQWSYNYNLFSFLGLGPNLSKEASNFFTPFAIDSALKRDFPLPWEIMDRELNTSTIMISPTIFNFDLGNLKKSFTMPSPFRSVFGLPENPYNIQRKCEECEEEEGGSIQRRGTGKTLDEFEAPSVVGDALGTAGRSMDISTLSFMESRFGYDFSDVRIHTDSLAAKSAQSINALAYTNGNNLVFNEGQYAPETDSGKRLLAHELTHVIQQAGYVNRVLDSCNRPLVSRMPYSYQLPIQRFIFWHEFTAGLKPRTGTDIHNELTPDIAGSVAESEAPIPNANRSGSVGFGESGRADFYKADKRLGVYFKYPVVGVCSDGEGMGTPATLRGGGKNGAPRLSKGKIVEIENAPTSITLGELKPATPEMVQFGKEQLTYYENGIKFASQQANCWSSKNSVSGSNPQWSFSKIDKFDPNSLPIPSDFQPGSDGQNRSLGVVDFVGMDEYDRKATKPEFTPKKDVGFEIMGGLYANHTGDGTIGYYFYPDDPAGILEQLSINPRDAKVRAYAEFANHLHRDVILPLFTGPEKVQTKRMTISSRSFTQDSNRINQIQRTTKKRSKLKDNFKLLDWKQSHQKHQDNFNKKLTETREALQLTELLYKGEESFKKINGLPGTKSLPPKSDLNIELDTNDPKKKETKNLSSLYGWMNVWAKEPMKFLGTLRDKFGGAFVGAANKFDAIKKKFQKLLRKSREKNEPKGLSYGAIAARAFWRAMVQAGDLVFDQTVELLVDSLESGVKNKMNGLIPLDVEELSKMADQSFPQLKELENQIETLEKEIETRLEEIDQKFETELEQIKQIAKDAETLGKVIKWAVVALNCVSPPGWGCLKLLLKKLIAKMVDEILKWCPVQKEFSEFVTGVGFVQELPKRTAGIAADFIESLLPKSITPVFDRTVFDNAVPITAEDIKCETGISEEQKALVELEEELKAKLGEDGFEALLEALRIYGVPPDEPLLASEIREMIDRIPDGVTTQALQTYIASNPKPQHGAGQKMDVAKFLEVVNQSQIPLDFEWFVIAHPPAQGHTKGESVRVNVSISPAQPCAQWSSITSFDVPARVTKRIFYSSDGRKLQIYYRATSAVSFQLAEQTHEIEAGKDFWGYRPDACKKE